MDDPEQRWNRLLEAAKPALREDDALPPARFGSRIARLRHSIRSLALALAWKRWSILAALLAALGFAILLWILSNEPTDRPPLIPAEPPSLPSAP